MFIHLFRYRFLSLVRNKEVTFWNILFPLVLGTLFFFGFGRFVNEEEIIETVSIAVVEEDKNQVAVFSEVMKQMEGSDSLFTFSVLTEENASRKTSSLEVAEYNSYGIISFSPS